jgi:two-component system, cell cycle sensor histidine kinase and response regulator CckA
MPNRPVHLRSPRRTDIAALVARLASAESALEQTLGPGADAVLDARGHAHLLRQAQVALQQSEEHYRLLFERAADVIFALAPTGTFTSLNPAFETLTGWPPSQWLGRAFREIVHPDDQTRAEELFQRLLREERTPTFGLRVRTAARGFRDVEFTGFSSHLPGTSTEVQGIGRDVTERKGTEAALHLQSAGLNAAANGIVITDRSGSVVWANSAFSTLTGYTLAEAAGKNPRDLLKSGQHEPVFYRQMWETILAGGVWRGELINRRKDGSCYPEDMTITPVRGIAGEITHFIAIKQDLTDRRQAESALRASEQEFRSLAESMPQIVWVTRPDGWNIYFNQQWVDYTGLTLEQSYGHGWSIPFHPDDRPRAWAAWQNATQNDTTYSVECRLRRADGAYRWWLVRGAPLRDASGKILKWFGTCTDIEELKQAAIALTQSEAEQRQLARSLALAQEVGNVGSWETDFATQAVGWSEQNHRIFETTPDVFQPTHARFMEFVHPDDRAAVDSAFLASFGSRAPCSLEHRIVLRDGRTKHVEERWQTFVDAENHPVRAIGTCRDITEKKLLEERFFHAQRLESLGMLAAGIAHDLNNVLAPILFAAPLLRGRLTAPSDLKILNTLESSASRGAGLVKQILGFVRTTSGEFRPTQVKHLANDIIDVIQETFPKSISFEHQIASDLWPVLGNATQIHQVLLNLCVNARDALPHGGTLLLTAANRRLDAAEAAAIPGARPGAWIVIEVGDTGTGIAPEVLEHIWTPFFTTKGAGLGTGLGLPTVSGLVISHHGFVELDTAVGRGSTFRVFLPAIEGEGPRSSSDSPFASPGGRGELILVVDDEAVIRNLVSQILDQHGYRSICCADGIEAIEVFNAHAGEVSVVITDVDMPRLGGLALVQTLRPRYPELRVIVMSGLSHSGVESVDLRGLEKLAHAFLHKPFTAVRLLEVLHQLLHSAATA